VRDLLLVKISLDLSLNLSNIDHRPHEKEDDDDEEKGATSGVMDVLEHMDEFYKSSSIGRKLGITFVSVIEHQLRITREMHGCRLRRVVIYGR